MFPEEWTPQLISAFSGVGMLIIWLIYLQLFFADIKRRNRPFLIIHHAQSNKASSPCLFVNMSKDPVHVQSVIAFIKGSNGNITRYLTDYDRLTPDDRDVENKLREGPIQPGGYLVLGSFEEILLGQKSSDDDQQQRQSDLKDYSEIELCVAVVHGPSEFNIGARRHFVLEHHKEDVTIRAYSIHTEQLVSRKKRKIVREWIEAKLKPQHQGEDQTLQTRQHEVTDNT